MKRFNNILCVVAPGAERQQALQRAVVLAENNQASLTVVCVAERVTSGVYARQDNSVIADLQAAVVSACEQGLNSLVAPYRQRIKVRAKVLIGTPFLEIIREVLCNKHDLVIKMIETWDWQDRLFGSDDMHLLRKCPCPVWLIKPGAAKSFQCILAAVDVDDACPLEELTARQALNRQTLEMAASLAFVEGAELHVAHAWEAMGESVMRSAAIRMPEEKVIAYIEQVRQRCQDNLDALIGETVDTQEQAYQRASLKVQTHLVKGNARKEIPALARQIGADLVVMGTVARTGLAGFIIGNTAETILNHIDCSVLAVKPPGFVTPVTLEE